MTDLENARLEIVRLKVMAKSLESLIKNAKES